MTSTGACEAFVSAPIKLAAKINERGRRGRGQPLAAIIGQQTIGSQLELAHCVTTKLSLKPNKVRFSRNNSKLQQTKCQPCRAQAGANQLLQCLSLATTAALLVSLVATTGAGALADQHQHLNSQLINHDDSTGARDHTSSLLRHHAHYLNFVPSAHFSYNEGRQANGRSLELEPASSGKSAADLTKVTSLEATSSHIYKRSSAVLMPPSDGSQNSGQPLVRTSSVLSQLSTRAALNPLSRRMMANGVPQLTNSAESNSAPLLAPAAGFNGQSKQPNWLGVGAPAASSADHDHESQPQTANSDSDQAATDQELAMVNNLAAAASHQPGDPRRRLSEQEAELLRQKQHIQYHDQWPLMAGKCHKRTLNFCASVLPFNTTTFPNIIGDTNRFEVKRSLPFFGFLAKSSCNKRLDELLCLLLEPPCSAHSGSAIPPCKKFCRLALEGCNEYIPATLALSSVFDCRQYPDSNDPSVCINLAQGSKCTPDEFKCPDKTCIPRNWVCDGVRDCIFAADEANCTDSASLPQASVCSTEEFKCDGKCVPKAWKCDGERDCLDGLDEESCDQRPRCGPDRFKCADGNGCIPKRWVCDGKAECRDGSDEVNCNQRQCSENDFQCDNGICIPKLWRCDRQFDCKDGSDERQCVYPTTSTSTSTSTSTPAPEASTTTTTTTPSPTMAQEMLQLNTSSSYGIEQQSAEAEIGSETSQSSGASKSLEQAKQQFEASLSGDISRIIQHERDSAQQMTTTTSTTLTGHSSSASPLSTLDDQQAETTITTIAAATRQEQQEMVSTQLSSIEASGSQQQVALARELKKFDYDLIPSASHMVQVNELPVGGQSIGAVSDSLPTQKQAAAGKQPLMTQINFVPPQRAMVGSGEQQANRMAQQHQQQQQQQQVRPDVNNFGAATPGPAATHHHQEPAAEPAADAPPRQQRIPIYRSLFKSLKGHHFGGHHQPAQHRLQLDRNGGPRNVVAIARRRRDRHQQHQAAEGPRAVEAINQWPQQQQFSETQDSLGGGQSGDSLIKQQQQAGSMMMMPLHQTQRHHHHQLLQQAQLSNQTLATVSAAGGDTAGSVASYLQRLNGRYNLRPPRVGGSVANGAPAAPSNWN